MAKMNRDGLYNITLLEGQARALLIESTALVERARRVHSLSRIATAALGRTLTATAMMGSMLKGAGESISATIKGGGPIGSIVTVGYPNGVVKGYVDNPAVDLPRAGKKLPVGEAVGNNGKLTVVKDLGLKEPYVGQTNLVSGEIAEDFAMYFTASEQTPSLVSLGVLVGDAVVSAGGLIIQMLPGASEAAIQSVELSANMYGDISGTMRDYGAQGAIAQLLGHLQPEVLSHKEPEFRCDCSKGKIERVLITLGAQELNEMIDEQGGAEVDCHFCNKRYAFSEDDLRALIAHATGGQHGI
ncbi:MAG: Hsp33 family molecular chaperone HslO [Christensenellales bacterium]|jgi:molecular chaperone Hsp33